MRWKFPNLFINSGISNFEDEISIRGGECKPRKKKWRNSCIWLNKKQKFKNFWI
jgi:hypothetical protein